MSRRRAGTGILRKAEAGMRVRDLYRRHGISAPLFPCGSQGGMDISDTLRLRPLENEDVPPVPGLRLTHGQP